MTRSWRCEKSIPAEVAAPSRSQRMNQTFFPQMTRLKVMEECDAEFERCLGVHPAPNELCHIAGTHFVCDSHLRSSMRISVVAIVRE
jgi:hypothetical protein